MRKTRLPQSFPRFLVLEKLGIKGGGKTGTAGAPAALDGSRALDHELAMPCN
jgi:hypothetical protein